MDRNIDLKMGTLKYIDGNKEIKMDGWYTLHWDIRFRECLTAQGRKEAGLW